MRNLFKLSIFFLILVVPFVSCIEDDDGDNAVRSILPEELINYKMVFHVTDIISNPDNVNVASRIEYRFISTTEVQGAGAVVLATESWTYTNDLTGGVFDFASIFLDYGALGTESIDIEFDGEESAIEDRQTFEYYGNLQGNATVNTVGYFEIEEL